MNTMNRNFAEKFIAFWLLTFALALSGQIAFAQPTNPAIPARTGLVNDFAGIIDAPTKARLEQKLDRLRKNTNPQITFVVATVQTVGENDVFQYSLEVARQWQIGSKADDNPGLLLFVAYNERKAFAQVSRNLEGDLTDGEAGQIQRNVLVPAFRAGQYGKGIEDTIDSYIQNVAESRGFNAAQIIGQVQQPTTPRRDAPRSRQPRTQASLGTCCIFLVIIVIILFIISSSRRGGGGRGGWGGGGGGGLLNGLILGSILSNSSGGGGWSSGGFGGGDSGGSSGGGDWGGGFGGGDFGGGGAGSDW